LVLIGNLNTFLERKVKRNMRY